MPEFIERDVRAMREASSSEPVDLLLAATEPRRQNALKEKLEELGATHVERVGKVSLRASVPKAAVDAICDLEEISSIELDNEDVYLQGNL